MTPRTQACPGAYAPRAMQGQMGSRRALLILSGALHIGLPTENALLHEDDEEGNREHDNERESEQQR